MAKRCGVADLNRRDWLAFIASAALAACAWPAAAQPRYPDRPIREHGPDRVIDHFDALFAALQELLAVEVC